MIFLRNALSFFFPFFILKTNMSANPILGAPVKDKFYNNFSSKCINLDCGKINVCDVRTDRVVIQNDTTLQFPQLLTRVELQDPVTFDVAGPITDGPVQFDTISIDDFGMYDLATNTFTVPAAGWWKITYNVCFELSFGNTPSGGGFFVGLVIKGSPQVVMKDVADVGSLPTVPNSQLVRNVETSDVQFFNAGETFTVNYSWTSFMLNATSGRILGQLNPIFGPWTYCVVQRIK